MVNDGRERCCVATTEMNGLVIGVYPNLAPWESQKIEDATFVKSETEQSAALRKRFGVNKK